MDQHHLDPGLANEVSLELYTIASQLERFSIDNGPHGESTPFSSESKRLRQIAQMIHERCGKHAISSSIFNPPNCLQGDPT